jgi:hypothetical protein
VEGKIPRSKKRGKPFEKGVKLGPQSEEHRARIAAKAKQQWDRFREKRAIENQELLKPYLKKKEEVPGDIIEASEEELNEQLIAIKRLKLENLQKMKSYQASHGSKYFEPFDYQEDFLDMIVQGKKVALIQGANQIGKTLIGSILIDTFGNCRQAFEWKNGALNKVFNGRPVKIRIIASDWEHHANEVIIPKMKEVIELGTYETRKNNIGVEAFWKFKTGSTIELMTHSQETKLHEGWTGDIVWSDEPLPQDKFVANRRGLVARSGLFFMTMTAISEPWIMDEIVLSNKPHIGCVTNIPMRSNKTLSEQDIQSFEDDVPASQRTARVQGDWLQLIGRVLKGYKKDKHIIDPFEVPTDWPVTVMIDVHYNKPQAISFFAVNQQGFNYVIDEMWEHLSPEEIADEIIRRKIKNAWDIDRVFIDPMSKGDASFMKNLGQPLEDSFGKIEMKLSEHQIQLIVASKDKKSGVLNLESWLTGVNKIPILYFFNSLPSYQDGVYGSLWEIVRWVYDKEGLPAKENDHFMENLYRYTLVGAEFGSTKDQYRSSNNAIGTHSESWMAG